jgi:hypothetical protein
MDARSRWKSISDNAGTDTFEFSGNQIFYENVRRV